ncbi:MAG: homing endonuclease associated repeat-containing protein [Sphingobacteriales bacterium]
MEFKLNDYHRNTPDKELLDDLKRVADKLGKNNLTQREYDEPGKYSSRTVQKRFKNWNNALQKAGLEITVQQNISDKELYENIEEVWISLGRQPKYDEIKKPLSKYSTGPYDKRFGTWRKALEAFVEFINSDNDQNQETEKIEENTPDIIGENEIIFKHKTKRAPSERLKVQVLMRDGNKCRLCGITVTGENIHFDHILAWSKGGETVLENLQVLCATHNLAKGNVEYDTK